MALVFTSPEVALASARQAAIALIVGRVRMLVLLSVEDEGGLSHAPVASCDRTIIVRERDEYNLRPCPLARFPARPKYVLIAANPTVTLVVGRAVLRRTQTPQRL
jgi:hypothetical protein